MDRMGKCVGLVFVKPFLFYINIALSFIGKTAKECAVCTIYFSGIVEEKVDCMDKMMKKSDLTRIFYEHLVEKHGVERL